MEFGITVDQKGPVAVLKLFGWFIYDVVSPFRQKVEEALEAGAQQMVVDLRGVSFMDSAGVGALVSALTSLRRKGGELALVGLTPEVRRVLELTRLLKLFNVYEDLEEVVKEPS